MNSLSELAFFKDLIDFDFTQFERRCSWKKVEAGQTIVDYEDLSNEVYFLLTGHVRILIRTAGGKEFILADLRDGEFFGELSAIDGETRSANVTALTRAVICIVHADVFREMLVSSTSMSNKVMQLLSRRIRALNARLLEHSVLDVRHNLYAELLRLSIPRQQAEWIRVVTPPPYHHVLAARIGCRREQITRELRMMEQEGLLQKARGGLVLPQPAILQTRIQQKMEDAG